METPVKNLVDAVDLTPEDALLPLFECVVNSIISLNQSEIEKEKKKIQIQIFRGNPPTQTKIESIDTISNIKIIDNGIGFNEENYKSFKTPLSQLYKEKFGCKGIGRFTGLAAFQEIHVKSTYCENDVWKYREFKFNAIQEIFDIVEKEPDINKNKTIVELINCNNQTILDRTAISVKDIEYEIMQHCLIYYLNDDLPLIEILDKDMEDAENVNDLYKNLSKERERSFDVKGQSFKIYIMKTLKENSRKNHYIHYCANSRVVGRSKNLNKVNSLFSYPIVKDGKQYFLDVYVVSKYLNKKVYRSRNGFTIPQENDNPLFGTESEISFQDIETKLSDVLEELFDTHVKDSRDRNIKEIEQYITSKAPRYRSFLRNKDCLNMIPYGLADEKKEEYLYKIAFKARNKVEEQIQKFISTKKIDKESIESITNEIKAKTAYDADSLADYMFRRKGIIDLFEKYLEADKNGEYKLESDLHKLIFPMGITIDDVDYETHNLWLLDERFATYKFIASDKPLSSVSQKKSTKEPDLILTDEPLKNFDNIFDNRISYGANNSGEISSLVIFELKRPGETAHQKNKTDYRWEYSDLIMKYFDDFIYNPDKKNYKGRSIRVDRTTPKFGYVILDVLPIALEEYNKDKGWQKTPFGSFYKMFGNINLHIEALTFAKLIEFARKRHNPFFDKLFVSK
ncbi:MAG: hypothetical protein LBH30_07465 [Prevotellaceae bacterium]|jgi:hypothetical protein|nr:hypothetical protein [Prevotellaceae bacterium]